MGAKQAKHAVDAESRLAVELFEEAQFLYLSIVGGNLPKEYEQPVEQFGCIVAVIDKAILFAEQGEERLPAQSQDEGIAEATAVGIVAFHLQLHQRHDDAIDRGVADGEAHRDVHFLYFFGNGVKHRQQQALVAENNGKRRLRVES